MYKNTESNNKLTKLVTKVNQNCGQYDYKFINLDNTDQKVKKTEQNDHSNSDLQENRNQFLSPS